MESWFKIEAKAGTVPTIYIYDEIGLFGVNAADFAKELKALGDLKGKPLKLRINSPGGDVLGGNSIMVLLRDSGAVITAYIDGVAASMASAIAMVADKVIIAEGAFMMIHNPAGRASGGSEDLRSTATLLDAIKEGMVTAYARKSGLSREAVAKMMDAETWLDAKQAVDAGFADEIGEVVKVTAYDLSRYSKNPPKDEPEALNKEVTMTKEELEALGAVIGTAVTAANKPVLDAIAGIKPAAKADEPVAGKVKTEAEIRAEIQAEATARSTEITDLCALAGLPSLTATYVAGAKTIAEVKTDLKAKKAEAVANRSRTGIDNHAKGPDDTGTDEDISDLMPKARSYTQIWDQFNSAGKRH